MLLSLAMHLCLLRSYAYQDEMHLQDFNGNRCAFISVAGTLLIHVETITPRLHLRPSINFIARPVTQPDTRLENIRYHLYPQPAIPNWVRGHWGYHYETGMPWGVEGVNAPLSQLPL